CDACFRRRFLERVRRTLNESKALKADSKIVIGVSGSCESLAMAKAVWKLESRYERVQASFVHVSRWRGREEEEAIAGAFEKLGLPSGALRTVSLKARSGFDLTDLVEEGIVAKEEVCGACRALVRGALSAAAARAGAGVLACGDSADELAEEALFLVCAGRRGRLGKMGAKEGLFGGRIWLVRPLGRILRSEAKGYLDSCGLRETYSCPHGDSRRRRFSGLLKAVEEKHPGSVFSALESLRDLAQALA
ncbi:MAG: hypothetical protein JTT11_00225, partial [Candidatus Brockarchaeota archaeon]|nr:hypothetical protein [Candidatus Brockarchaeota archaeon]